MGEWLAPWKSYTIAADDVRALEPDRVVVLTRHRGQLKGGGEEVRTLGVDLWTLREGRRLRAGTAAEIGPAAGIDKRVHAHGLRHTFTAELAREGKPIHVIRDALGHSTLATTDRYLRDVAPVDVIEAMAERG